MANDERDERPDQEGFTAQIIREATVSGTPDEPPPPGEPQSAAFPRGGAGADGDDEPGEDEGEPR
jgi:hypothetical protein